MYTITSPVAQHAKVTPLLSKDLTNLPGKEGLVVTVEYPPGSSDPIHRHNAHAFVYVLEGSIVLQVRGGKETTLTPGQTFYEGPDDVHVVGAIRWRRRSARACAAATAAPRFCAWRPWVSGGTRPRSGRAASWLWRGSRYDSTRRWKIR